jgi:hypothetical protein
MLRVPSPVFLGDLMMDSIHQKWGFNRISWGSNRIFLPTMTIWACLRMGYAPQNGKNIIGKIMIEQCI